MANAYGLFSPACRAAIKTGIAISHFHFGRVKGLDSDVFIQPYAGFERQCKSYPHKWTLIIFDGDFKRCACLCAAAMLPLLAGVKLVGAVCLDDTPAPQALLTLELCGIEDIFELPAHKTMRLIKDLAVFGEGSLIIFSQNPAMREIWDKAQNMGISLTSQSRTPNVLLLDQSDFNPETLDFCLGFLPKPGLAEGSQPIYAVYGIPSNDRKPNDLSNILHEQKEPCLYLAPGCEGFWLFKDLGPDFFRSKNMLFQFMASKYAR